MREMLGLRRRSKRALLLFAASFLFILAPYLSVNAQSAQGTLSLSPSTGVYTAGSTFLIRVLVNTGGTAINAAEGKLHFNNAELSVVSVSEAGSIFNLWTTEPEFSNGAGTITFGGGSPKGYIGSAGQIFTITFKALRESTSRVDFTSGVILAADGRGTNIVSSLNGGVYTIGSQKTTPPPEYVVPDNTPGAPVVTSSTHPDGGTWYTSKDVVFSWKVPSDVTNVRLTADHNAHTIPTVFYDSPITGKTLKDFDEGAWYLHVQFKNDNGWGKITHFPFNIDATKPESFTITEVTGSDPTDPRVAFRFDAVDTVSGISDYEIQMDGGDTVSWHDDGPHIYHINDLEPGQHTMVVRALDKAGNSLVESTTFTVEALVAPVITDYPSELASGSTLVIRGKAIPDSAVNIFVKEHAEEPKTFTVPADSTGAFTFIMDDKLADGTYQVWAQVSDGRGAKSADSKEVTVLVRPIGFIRIGNLAVSFLSVAIPLIALVVLAALLLLYGARRVREFRRAVRKEVTEAEEVLHESFTKLHFSVQEHVKKLEVARKRRDLTKEEEHMVSNLNKALNEAERVVSKEIRDIRRVK